jgi:hypothetical protein
MKIKEQTMRLFYAEWIDSQGHEGWVELGEAETEDLIVRSVGWLVGENEVSVTISGHISADWCHAPITIPKPVLLKWKEIELVDISKA